MIHNSWALLGRRSALIAGTARCSTVRSITYSRAPSASTASPIHSRRPALGAVSAVTLLITLLLKVMSSMRSQLLRLGARQRLIGPVIRRDRDKHGRFPVVSASGIGAFTGDVGAGGPASTSPVSVPRYGASVELRRIESARSGRRSTTGAVAG